MLYAMPELEAADRRVLRELDEMHAALRAQMRAAPRWGKQLRRSLFAAAIQGSNTIENITISGSDARALVEHAPMSADASEETRQAVAGYRDALSYVQQTPLLDFFEYSEMLLSTLHFVTSADRFEPAYTGPDADRVPGLMGELVEWLRAGL